jgi:hypothetical protein
MKRVLVSIVVLMLAVIVIVTALVESEVRYRHERIGGAGPARALVLFHPSREAHFSDDLSLAVARGLIAAGIAVDRATLSDRTPRAPTGYALIAVVSNTYWWTPDRPTRTLATLLSSLTGRPMWHA